MSNKLIISNFYNDINLGFLFENDTLIQIKKIDDSSVVGNIYCGRVGDVVKNIDACFVDFLEGYKGFMSMQGQKYKSGDKVLVQVVRDKTKTKDYSLTTDFDLKGKYLVLSKGKTGVSISKKIVDDKKREELKSTLGNYLNSNYGFVVRTSASNATENELINDAQLLVDNYNLIQSKSEHSMPKVCLMNNNSVEMVISDYINKYNCEIITDNMVLYEQIKRLSSVKIDLNSAISLHNKYSLMKHIQEAISKKVWLKSGGYLIIEPTEALTVVDVNTGKAVINVSKNNTNVKINREAAFEIMRQLKVRNISGMIVVDFLNMNTADEYEELVEYMKSLALEDYTKTYIVDVTKLGLVEITRKMADKPLYEIINN